MNIYKSLGLVAVLIAATSLVSGCAGEKPAASNEGSASASVDDHSGWWCAEHGVPEAECSQCSASYAKECKAKGDWCAEHNRAESQCFICDPSRADKFAKLYEAKNGKKPPAVTE